MGDGPAKYSDKRSFGAILGGALVLDATTGRILQANNAAATILSFASPEEMVGQNPLDYVPDEDRQPVAVLLAQGLETDRPTPAEIRVKTKDGRLVWLSVTSALIEHEGKRATLIAMREITSEKTREAALMEAERLYQRLFETMLDGAAVLDVATTQVLLANQAAASMLGFASPEEMVSENPLDYVPKEDQERVVHLVADSIERGYLPPTEIRLRNKDGRLMWVSLSASLIEHGGKKATLAIIRDITSDKEREAALREAESRYERLFDGMPDGAVVLDVSTFEIALANKAAAEMAGFDSPREVVGINPLSFIPEEDRDEVTRMIALNLEGKGPNPAEIRLVSRDKREIWVSATATRIEYEGRTATLATLRDITADKAKDAALRAAEESRLRLMDAAAEAITIVQDGELVYVNPAVARGAGIPEQQLIGLPFLDLVHPEEKQAVWQRYERIMAGEWPPEIATIRGVDAKGETLWAEVREIPFTWQGKPAVMSLIRNITEEVKAQEALRDSEEHFRTLIEKATDVVIVLDASGKITYQSPSLERVTGFGHNEWLDRSLGELLIHPDDMPYLAATLERILAKPGATFEGITVRYQHKDRSWHTLEATVTNMLHDPKVNGIVANFRDITDRKATEEALKRSEALLKATETLTGTGGWEYDVQTGAMAWTDETYRIHEVPKVPTIDHISESLKCYPPPARQVIEEAFQKCVKEGITYDLELPFITFGGNQRWVRTCAKAIREGDRIVRVLGNIADITERKRMEDALRTSEERNRLLVENASEVIAVIQDGLLKLINPKVTDFVGYLPEELVFRPFAELVYPDDRQMVADNYVRRLSGEQLPNNYQFRVTHKNGGVRWAEISVALFEWEGRPATLALLNDITERREAETALRESEERFRQIAENMLDAISLLDANGIIKYASPSHQRIVGYAPEDMVGKSVFDFVPPEDVDDLTAYVARMQGEAGFAFRYRFRHSDGHYIWGEASAKILHDDAGNVSGYVIASKDVTDRRNAEEALRASEAKYRRLFESTQTAMEVIDMTTGLVALANEATARMFGFASPDDLVGIDSMQYLRPEDIGWVAEKMAQAVTDSSWQEIAELQVRTNDGRWLWISGMVIQSEYQGKPALLVSLLDITSRKHAEETLRESEQKYRLLTEKTNDVIYTIDLDLNNTYVSPSVERILGFTPEEYLAIGPDQRMTLESLARAQEALLEHLSLENDPKADPNRTVRIELEFYRKDGSTAWLEHQVSGLRDANGIAIGLHGVARDIEERRKAEQAVRESEQKYRLLANKTNDIIWTSDLTLHTTYVSPSVEKILGFTPEERLAQDPTQQMTPESSARAAEALAQHLALDQDPKADPSRTLRIELEYYRKDGSTIWLENQVSGIRDASGKLIGFHGVARDVTERRKSEQALRESEEKYRLLAEKTTDLIWTSDINMRPTYMSPSVEMIIGITPEEGLGRNLAAIMTPESLARATEVLAHHLALEEDPSADPNRTLKVELEFYRKDGSTVWLEEHVSGIRDTDGKLVGFHGVARDVSDRKRMEDSLDERLKELQCIAGISRLAERPELPVEEFVRGVVGLLPPAWHYPESCAA
ncbi:MAG: PAS domain S-box protein, partial [Dehalococcoidia bacterium]|nr:PAS domain S-box protein [Dehalococcoidia bacterium]